MSLQIMGSGYAKAEKQVFNDEFATFIDTSDEWISTRTGIKSRYFSITETTSDLAVKAALMAIFESKIDPKSIKAIIVATMTGDNFTPSTASLVQAKLGLNEQPIMAFDLNAACTGFIYGLTLAESLLSKYDCILVIGAELLSKILDFNDRNTCVLFGDGAGAMIVKRSTKPNNFFSYCDSIGDLSGCLTAKGIRKDGLYTTAEPQPVAMAGQDVFRFAIKALEDSILHVCQQADISVKHLDWIIPHQANIRIIEYVSKKMGIPINKFYLNIAEFGNTSAASVPIAYAQATAQNQILKGHKVVLAGFGGGFTYGACYIEV